MAVSKRLFNLLRKFNCLVKLGVLLFLCTATVQAHQATLTWDASAGATPVGYRIYYGQASGNYTSSIDVGLQTKYTVSDIQEGTYYFAVTAYDSNGIESTVSNEISKNFGGDSYPSSHLPSPWLAMDIGDVGLAGSASFTDGTFMISGSGADISGITDAFHFVYQPLSGDGTMIIRVASNTHTDSWAKVGVMIRENLDANARYAMVAVTPRNGVVFQHRLNTGEDSYTYHTTSVSAGSPCWVKLVRTGDEFIAYQSDDGSNWVVISSAEINMASSLYIGLAVTSHTNHALNIAKLDNVNMVNN